MEDNTFQRARIKLTMWYLLMIFAVCTSFSFAFYRASTREIERIIEHVQSNRIRENVNERIIKGPPPGPPVSIEELQNTKRRLTLSLLLINAFVVAGSGVAAYLLAGKTLKPIHLMIDDQSQFISDASHELRTPIATMRAEMEASLLEKNFPDKKARILIKSNLEELGNLQDLVNNLLKIARIHSLSENQKTQDLSLLDIVKTAVKKSDKISKEKDIKFSLKIKENIIQGYKDSLVELFVILFDNAVKYSPKGSVITLDSGESNDSVLVYVKDQGPGIAEEDIPHIFERFYRADRSRSLTPGYGLGLSIAKKIVKAHKGKISVRSEKGKGSTFIIEFPS